VFFLLILISEIFEKPTRDERPWIIPFYSGKNSWLTVFMAIVPAIIATILIFMDQQITAVIANRKELKLKVTTLRPYVKSIFGCLISKKHLFLYIPEITRLSFGSSDCGSMLASLLAIRSPVVCCSYGAHSNPYKLAQSYVGEYGSR